VRDTPSSELRKVTVCGPAGNDTGAIGVVPTDRPSTDTSAHGNTTTCNVPGPFASSAAALCDGAGPVPRKDPVPPNFPGTAGPVARASVVLAPEGSAVTSGAALATASAVALALALVLAASADSTGFTDASSPPCTAFSGSWFARNTTNDTPAASTPTASDTATITGARDLCGGALIAWMLATLEPVPAKYVEPSEIRDALGGDDG